MYAQLGDIVFQGAFGPTAQELTGSATYAQHALIMRKPRLQRTGSALDELKLGMKLHHSFCDPQATIVQLAGYRDNGDVLRYINGLGRLIGTFVITEIKETSVQLGPNGKLMECDLELSLLESVATNTQSSQVAAAIAAGFAYTSNNPIEYIPSIPASTPIQIAALRTSSINSRTALIDSTLAKAEGDGANVADYLAKAKTSASKMQDDINEAVTQVNLTVGDVYDQTRQYESACVSAIENVAAFIEACETGELVEAVDAFTELAGANQSIMTSAEILSELAGARLPIEINE